MPVPVTFSKVINAGGGGSYWFTLDCNQGFSLDAPVVWVDAVPCSAFTLGVTYYVRRISGGLISLSATIGGADINFTNPYYVDGRAHLQREPFSYGDVAYRESAITKMLLRGVFTYHRELQQRHRLEPLPANKLKAGLKEDIVTGTMVLGIEKSETY